ncbi:uncharacterized protein LOC124374389 [Homalodisca vitripennis]|uniref:uncharacterized protein LOC124374389 n=1 Tax=Homalodisca vitripennis TaxID=197043 RepID=UPI001EEBC222|nr:uncharacterized protein LOC124374389 [Homalodisca vitripennis]
MNRVHSWIVVFTIVACVGLLEASIGERPYRPEGDENDKRGLLENTLKKRLKYLYGISQAGPIHSFQSSGTAGLGNSKCGWPMTSVTFKPSYPVTYRPNHKQGRDYESTNFRYHKRKYRRSPGETVQFWTYSVRVHRRRFIFQTAFNRWTLKDKVYL